MPEFELRHRMALALEWAQITRGEMRRVLGVHRNTVDNYLNGRTHPRRGDLVAWALRCGVSLHWLLNGEEPDPDDPVASTKWYEHLVTAGSKRDRSAGQMPIGSLDRRCAAATPCGERRRRRLARSAASHRYGRSAVLIGRRDRHRSRECR